MREKFPRRKIKKDITEPNINKGDVIKYSNQNLYEQNGDKEQGDNKPARSFERDKKKSIINFLAFVIGGIFGYLINKTIQSHGITPSGSKWLIDVAMVVLAIYILYSANKVRLYLKGKNPSLTAGQATKALMLARSGEMCSAFFTGFYLFDLLSMLDFIQYEFMNSYLVNSIITIACGIALFVASLIAEQMCKIPPAEMDKIEKKRIESEKEIGYTSSKNIKDMR